MNQQNEKICFGSSPVKRKYVPIVGKDRHKACLENHNQTQQSQALQLKIHMLFSRLNKTRHTKLQNAQERSPLSFSKSRTSKIAYKKQSNDKSGAQIFRQMKQRLHNQFELQFQILVEEYHVLTQAKDALISQKNERSRITQQYIADIRLMVEKMKDMSLSLSLSPKNLKVYTQICSKKKKMVDKRSDQTPFRLSLTPFHKENSLLISVKRSLEGQGAYNQTAKKSQKEGNDIKSCEYFPSVTEQPLHSKKEQQSSYKDFIKETEQEEDPNKSFDAIEHQIVQKFHVATSNHQKSFQKIRVKVDSCMELTNDLSLQIAQERHKCEIQWKGIEDSLKTELNFIYSSILECQRSSQSMEGDRQQIFLLMQESVEDVLQTQRKAYRSDHTSIIDNLHQVISIFQ